MSRLRTVFSIAVAHWIVVSLSFPSGALAGENCPLGTRLIQASRKVTKPLRYLGTKAAAGIRRVGVEITARKWERRYGKDQVFRNTGLGARQWLPKEAVVSISNNGRHSVAVAAFSALSEHYHPVGSETYEVRSGIANVVVDGKQHVLRKGDRLTIEAGQKHFGTARGLVPSIISAYSTPGWTPENQVLVQPPTKQ